MGFYSWTCAKTQLPIMAAAPARSRFPKMSEIILLRPDHVPVRGIYDGNGTITSSHGGVDLADEGITDEIRDGKAKLVLAAFYAKEAFEDLGRSFPDPGQGFFHDEHFIRQLQALGERGGQFASFGGYALAFSFHLPVSIASTLTDAQATSIVEKLNGAERGVDRLCEAVQQAGAPPEALAEISKAAAQRLELPMPAEDVPARERVALIVAAHGLEEASALIREAVPGLATTPAP